MLSAAVGRYVCHRTLDDLQQRLLYALAADVAGDGGILRFSANLINFIDVDDAGLGALHIPVRRLDQAQQDVLDVLADISRLGQGGRVGDGERHIHRLCQRLRKQSFADTGGAHQQNVALGDLHAVVVVL